MNVAVTTNSTSFIHRACPRVDEELVRLNSRKTIDAVMSAIRRTPDDHATFEIEAGAYLAGSLLAAPPHIVFNIAPGLLGSYCQAYAPQVFESVGFPYTGSDPLTTALCQDKISTKDIFKKLRISTPRGVLLNSMDDLKRQLGELKAPLIVKPNNRDGIGVSEVSICRVTENLVEACEALFAAGLGPLIVEDFIEGREISVCVIGNADSLHFFPFLEIDFDDTGMKIFGEEMREALRTRTISDVYRKAKLFDRTAVPMREWAARAFRSLGCKDWAQIDFRLGVDQIPYMIEVNPLPDLEPLGECSSRYVAAAEEDGVSLQFLVQSVLREAVGRADFKLEDEEDAQLDLGLMEGVE